MEITTSASTQTHITQVGASVLLREVGCHSACVEYLTRAAKHNTGEGRNRVGGQTLRFGIRFDANEITLHSRLQWVTVDIELNAGLTWGLGSWMNERCMIWFHWSYCPLLCNGRPTSAAIMEAEKRLGPALTLGNNKRDTEKDSHPLCDLFCGLDSHSSPGLPLCVQGPSAVHSDWGWLRYYFINYVFPLPPPLPPVFLLNEGGGATPFLPSVLWRFKSPPSLLIIVSITHPSSPSPISLFLSHCSSFFPLLSHPKSLYTFLPTRFSPSLSLSLCPL